MEKIIAVPGWMFGMDIKKAEVIINNDMTVTAIYQTCVGWMAKIITDKIEFESINHYMNYCDTYLTILYANSYLTDNERFDLNTSKLDVYTKSSIAICYAREKFTNKTAIDFLNKKITLKM